MHMLAGLSDGGGGDTYATEIRAASQPAQRGFRLPQLSADPRQWVKSTWNTSTTLLGGATRALGGAVGIVDGLLWSTPTSLVGSVATMRRYAAAVVNAGPFIGTKVIRDRLVTPPGWGRLRPVRCWSEGSPEHLLQRSAVTAACPARTRRPISHRAQRPDNGDQ